jgi:leucyl aminopeptidase
VSSAPGYQAPTVTVSSTLPARGISDAVLVVGVLTGDTGPTVAAEQSHLDAATVAAIESGLKALGATGSEGQVHRLVIAALPVASVLTVGLGEPRDEWPADTIRRAAGTAGRSLDKASTAVAALAALDLGATIEGLILGAYRFTDFRSAKTAPKDKGLTKVVALAADAKAATKAQAQRAVDIATAVATARNFVNTPPSHLYPAEFAKQAKELGETLGLTVQILDDKALIKGGYGGIVGVGQGSARLPRLVRLTYRGGGKKGKTVALVGKGVTFDTGGISIKPAAGMHHMTSDMGGAAAVIATVVLAAKQKLPIDVIATIPIAENMPSATAQRPGDVLTQYGGITVEVLNTDAEGRLILADAIVRACEDDPDYLIETSTLTGAQTVALGSRTPGVMGSDEFRDRVATLSQSVGENGWAMPLPDELKDDLKSTVADLANISSSRYAGMLVAGVFLREFVADDVQWAHIDIAAPAYNTSGPWGYTPKGGTGVPVRTMFAALEDIADNG